MRQIKQMQLTIKLDFACLHFTESFLQNARIDVNYAIDQFEAPTHNQLIRFRFISTTVKPHFNKHLGHIEFTSFYQGLKIMKYIEPGPVK